MTTTTVEIDGRGRLTLGKLTKGGTYRASMRDDGSILLEPARLVTDAELSVLRNAEVSDAIASVFDGTAEAVPFDWKS